MHDRFIIDKKQLVIKVNTYGAVVTCRVSPDRSKLLAEM